MWDQAKLGVRGSGREMPGFRNARGIRADAGHLHPTEQVIAFIAEPGWVAGLADDGAGHPLAHQLEESACDRGVELQAGRKLHEKGSELVTELTALPEKAVDWLDAVAELANVGDLLRQLDREPKVRRHAVGPAAIAVRAVRAMEGGVDLGRREASGVASQGAI